MIPQNGPVSRWMERGWTLLFCLLLLTGCSSKGTVSGRITYQGKPIPQGIVLFVPEKGQSITGTITDGQYQVKGIVSGTAKIAVQTPKANVSKAPTGSGQVKGKEIPKDAPLPPGIDPSIFDFNAQISQVKSTSIPEKYGDPEKSGLTCTVKGGAQEHNIELK
jgi:hypothetical protein